MTQGTLRVFTFPAGWGLPTTGPFGLKLEACLRMLDLPFERVYEMDNRKGPKRKSPWIEDGTVRMGDTELILDHLAKRHGKRLDEELTPVQRAHSHVIRVALEERFHSVFEYELFVRDDGWAVMVDTLGHLFPPVIGPLIGAYVRRNFTKHLYERGIARHEPAAVEAMGKADVDAIAALLDGQEWLVADHPTKVDASAFGLLAVAVCSGLPGPVCSHARSLPAITAYVDRGRARFLG